MMMLMMVMLVNAVVVVVHAGNAQPVGHKNE